MKVTFDFDSTLSHKIVQKFAKELISKGVDVWVLTSRFDDFHKHRYPSNPTNDDLYAITDLLGIPRTKIRFQCMRPKAEYLHESNAIWHLDDDEVEIYDINNLTQTTGICVTKSGWKKECNRILSNHFKNKNHDNQRIKTEN